MRVIYNAEMKILFKANLTFHYNQMKVDKMKYASDGSYRKVFFSPLTNLHITLLHYIIQGGTLQTDLIKKCFSPFATVEIRFREAWSQREVATQIKRLDKGKAFLDLNSA